MTLPFEITLTVAPKTVSLDKKAVEELCELLLKAAEGDPHARIYFNLSGGGDSVLSSGVEGLAKARWPANIIEILLSVESYNEGRSIRVHLSPTVKEIVVSAMDGQWATLMAGELEAFVSSHRNNHWFFQELPLVAVQASVFLVVLLEGINQLVIPKVDTQYTAIVGTFLIISSISIVAAYVWGVRRLFPIVVVDSSRRSAIAVARRVMSWVIPIAMAALLVNFIWQYLS